MDDAEHDKGLRTARRYALWHIGDPEWADEIIRAYLNPDEVIAELNKARTKYDNE